VAPLVTAACFLSVLSAAGCDYVDISVGFTPTNSAWNISGELQVGLFLYHDSTYTTTTNHNAMREFWLPGCRDYSDIFTTVFVEKDRTWKVARSMSLVAGLSGICSLALCWVFVLTPMSAKCLWPCVLLPLTMLSFIAEGCKFLFFEIALCSNALWFPTGVNSRPQSAQACTLGQSAMYGIAAGSLYLIALIMVCLKTPHERVLDPDYGVFYRTGNEHDVEGDGNGIRDDDEVMMNDPVGFSLNEFDGSTVFSIYTTGAHSDAGSSANASQATTETITNKESPSAATSSTSPTDAFSGSQRTESSPDMEAFATNTDENDREWDQTQRDHFVSSLGSAPSK
jgi:hypothetical protein